MSRLSIFSQLAAGLLLGVAAAQAQTYTEAFPGLSFNRPLWMEEIPSKPEHLMVLEQVGTVQVVRKVGNAWTKTEFVKITVTGGTNPGNEQGLLGFAFHPQFATNRKYYLYYVTSTGGAAEVIEERLADATLLKDAGGQPKTILRIADFASNHNGGSIGFGKDGFLYIGTGDGGNQNDPNGNGQKKEALLAKMLRIDVNKSEGGKAYGIPSDNPFAAGGGAPEVYAYGFRNPYRWAFDPLNTDLWLADVGQGAMEEVDLVQKGGNYGWKVSEGTNGVTGDIKGPVFAYPHNGSTNFEGVSVIGGYVFRGNPASRFYGQYIIGDYGDVRNMWAVAKPANGGTTGGVATVLAKPAGKPHGFGTDKAGRLYLMATASISSTPINIYRLSGADWDVSTTTFLPREGNLTRSIGCIFTCRPGSKLDAKAFGEGAELEILGLSGERKGRVSKDGELPGLQAGMYILKSAASAKPNLLMIR